MITITSILNLKGVKKIMFFIGLFLTPYLLTAQDYQFRYVIDKSQVPEVLNVKEATFIVNTGAHTSAQVFADGVSVPFTYKTAANENIVFTTNATELIVVLTGVANPNVIGGIEIATLKHNKKWAVSIGFDDNKNFLNTAIPYLQNKGWKGTLFMTHAGFYLNNYVYRNPEPTYFGDYYVGMRTLKT